MSENENHEQSTGDCDCELVSQSDESPGLVKSSETVVRTLFSPEHIEQSGALKTNSVRMEDLQDAERGCSVDRLDEQHGSLGDIVKRAKDKTKPGRKLILLAQASVESIRQLATEHGVQVFCVTDTALEHRLCHADIFLHQTSDQGSRAELQVWRRKLIDIMVVSQIEIEDAIVNEAGA